MSTFRLQAVAERLAKDESGSNALEYGLIVGLISLAIIAGATAAGLALSGMLQTLANTITAEAKLFP
jgi:pilus assembly protein Flp/PilA